jgi:S1-C subfamily serine protease
MVSPVLGVVIDAQSHVLYLEPRSGAQQAGIKVGDTLTELDGIQFAPALRAATAEESLVYGQAIQALRMKIGSGKVMKLTLRRGSQLITLNAQAKPYPAREHQPVPTAVPPNRLYM